MRIFFPRRATAAPPVDRPVPGTGTLPDAGGAGYHVGVLSANPDSHGKTTYDHFYHYKLKDAKAAVEIRATDCFGKVYTQNVFTTAAETDYPMVDNYPAVAE